MRNNKKENFFFKTTVYGMWSCYLIKYLTFLLYIYIYIYIIVLLLFYIIVAYDTLLKYF